MNLLRIQRFRQRRSSFAILGAGTINLKTGNSKCFNVIENVSGSGGALFLLKRQDWRGSETITRYKVVSGSGDHLTYAGFQVNDNPQMHFDQNPSRLYECDWKVIASGPTSTETLAKFMEMTGKASVGLAVFK